MLESFLFGGEDIERGGEERVEGCRLRYPFGFRLLRIVMLIRNRFSSSS